jgi:aspartyl-tRNA(Asn)/glutamyl-tRNA(Gln) amidotransferase subunit B
VAHWFSGDVAHYVHELGMEAELCETPVTAAHVAELVRLVEEHAITSSTAKEVIAVAFESGEMPAAIVEARGLSQVTDAGALEAAVRAAIEANPKAVEDYRGGKGSAIGFLLGQVMRQMQGRADANAVSELLRRELDVT